MVPTWRQPGANLPHLAAPLQTFSPESFEQCGLYPCIKCGVRCEITETQETRLGYLRRLRGLSAGRAERQHLSARQNKTEPL